MSTNTWSALANSTWNVDANWSGGHVPTSSEDVVFDITSTKNCTVDVSPSINSLTIAAAFTGTFDMSGQTMTIAANMSDHGATGVHTYGNGFTFNGNSAAVEFHPGAAPVGTNAILTFNGTTAPTLAVNTDMSSKPFKQLVLAASAVLTCGSGTIYFKGTGPLVFTGAGSTLTTGGSLYLYPTASSDLWTIGGVLNGTGQWRCYISASSITVNVSAVNYTGSGALYLDFDTTRTNSTWMWTGNMSWGSGVPTMNGAGAGTIFDLNGYNITTTSSSGITFGAVNLTAAFYMRTGTITTTDFIINNYVGTTFYFNDCNVAMSKNLTIGGTNPTIYAGNALITISGTSTITSATGKTLPTIKINAIGKLITLAANLTCNNFITMNGTVIYGAFAITTLVMNPVVSANEPLRPIFPSTCINMISIPYVSVK